MGAHISNGYCSVLPIWHECSGVLLFSGDDPLEHHWDLHYLWSHQCVQPCSGHKVREGDQGSALGNGAAIVRLILLPSGPAHVVCPAAGGVDIPAAYLLFFLFFCLEWLDSNIL